MKRKKYGGYERRTFIRLLEPLPVSFRIRNSKGIFSESHKTKLVDIGPGGVCLEMPLSKKKLWQKVKQKSELELSITLPDSDRPIKAQGKVVWIQRGSGKIGLVFIKVAEGGSVKIAKYIELKCVQEGYEYEGGLLTKPKS